MKIKASTIKQLSLVMLLLLMCSSGAWAITDCFHSPGLQADGREVILENVDHSATNYYFVAVVAGHSYSLEVTNNRTTYDNASELILGLHAGDCTATSHMFTNTSSFDPDITGTDGRRISFVAAATTNLQVSVNNPNPAAGVNYNIQLTDTTLHNPRWSTFAGFITQYGFRNTTSTPISVTLSLTDVLGVPTVAIPTTTFIVPANGEVFKTVSPTGDIAVPEQ